MKNIFNNMSILAHHFTRNLYYKVRNLVREISFRVALHFLHEYKILYVNLRVCMYVCVCTCVFVIFYVLCLIYFADITFYIHTYTYMYIYLKLQLNLLRKEVI